MHLCWVYSWCHSGAGDRNSNWQKQEVAGVCWVLAPAWGRRRCGLINRLLLLPGGLFSAVLVPLLWAREVC